MAVRSRKPGVCQRLHIILLQSPVVRMAHGKMPHRVGIFGLIVGKFRAPPT